MISSIASSLLVNLPFLLLAATGGLLAERSGIAVLCLEGLALVGAFTSVWVAANFLNLWLALAAGVVGGVILVAFHALAVLRYKVNHFVSGLVVNLLSGPLCVLLLKWQFGATGQSPPVEVRLVSWNLAGISVPSALLLSIVFFLVGLWLLTKTRYGCWSTACGQNVGSVPQLP